MKKPLFVICGASGFIGQHLTGYLVKQGETVLCYSRKVVLNKYQGAEYHTISNYEEVDFPSDSTIFHLAETHHIKEVEEKGALYIQEAMELAIVLLKKSFRRFIYASSTTVYGDATLHPHKPDSKLPAGKTVYARAKLAVEGLVVAHGGVVVRLTNTFGQGMSQLNIFADILKQMEKDTIQLREATPVRDYIWIEDLVEALYKIGLSDVAGIYNIASGRSISCVDLCRLIVNLKRPFKEKKTIFLNSDRWSVINIDISETEKIFSWTPKHSLESGILKLFKNRYE